MKLYETINAHNWVKGTLQQETARCLGGHLLEAHLSTQCREIEAAIKLLYPERIDHNRPFSVVCFNDHPDTTIEDVIRVCKVADV